MTAESIIQVKLCQANNLLDKAKRDYKHKNYLEIIEVCDQILTIIEQILPETQNLPAIENKILEALFTAWVWMGRAYHKLGYTKCSQECFDKEKYFLIKLYETK